MNLIEKLFPYNACLLGEGYDARLNILKEELPLDIIEIPSGTQFSTWTVPSEWVVRDAWVKYKGKKIIDYKKNPLSLVVGAIPFQGKVSLEELKKHVYFTDNKKNIPYVFKYYTKEWGFCHNKELKEGEYEVFIDTEFRPGVMKLGVHTIPGKTDKEILLFAHLDHPFQANDNLSGVACVVDIAKRIKSEHTIKIVFCPETIGSIAYAHTQDLSKVDFVIAVDCCGNEHRNGFLLLKAWDLEAKINRYAHCAFQMMGKQYRKGKFRGTIGSDETVFNDPDIGIDGICLTTHPFDEYHTDQDTPEKINYDKIKEMADLVIKIIEVADMDYVPVKNFKGPLFRTKYGIQSIVPQLNLNYDYLFYSIDGKRSLAELCAEFELNFDEIYKVFEKIIADGKLEKVEIISRRPSGS